MNYTVLKKIGSILTSLFFIMAFLVVQLYLHNGYTDVIDAKAMIYFKFSMPLLVICLVFFIFCLIKKQIKLSFNIAEIFLIIFAVNSLISTLYSSKTSECFFGSQGWYIGSYTIISFILFIFIIKYFFEFSKYHIYVLSISIFIICTIGIFHSMAIDLFELHKYIELKQYFSYISTIGNNNCLSGYLNLLIPLFFGLYIFENNKVSLFFELLALIPMIFCITLCNSESVYLGLIFFLVAAIPFIFKNETHLKKSALVLLIYAISLFIINNCSLFRFKAETFDAIFKITLSNYFSLPLIIFSIGLFFLKIKDKYLKIITYILEILFLLLIISIFVYVYLNWNPYFGNNRGRIWEYTYLIFKMISNRNDYGIRFPLHGIGPEMLSEWYYAINVELRAIVRVAHSEFMQTLVTLGLVGAISYLGFYLSTFISFIKNKLWNKNAIIYVMPIFAYFGQALVNSMYLSNGIILAFIVSLYLKELSK